MAELTLTGLRVLREVVARGSFTAAADSLGYTQSAVSRQVAALEVAAGAPLFARESRGVRLTDAGRVLIRHADRVLDQVEAARHELGAVEAVLTGRLRLGAFPTAVAALVPRALVGFRARHGSVEVALREGPTPSQLRRLAAGEIDLAVVATMPGDPPDDARFVFEQLADDPLLLAVGRDHPLAGHTSVSLDDLRTERWIAGSDDAREALLGLSEVPAWQPRVELVAREWTAKLGLVAAGLGVTLVPGLAAPSVRADVGLVQIRDQPARRAVAVATRAGRKVAPWTRAFVDELQDVAAQLAGDLRRRVQDR